MHVENLLKKKNLGKFIYYQVVKLVRGKFSSKLIHLLRNKSQVSLLSLCLCNKVNYNIYLFSQKTCFNISQYEEFSIRKEDLFIDAFGDQ